SQAVEETGYDYQTLRDDAWVAGAIDLSRRRDNLSWSHHKEVASLPEDEQDAALDEAEREGLTRNQLRQRVQKRKQEQAAVGPTDTCTVRDLDVPRSSRPALRRHLRRPPVAVRQPGDPRGHRWPLQDDVDGRAGGAPRGRPGGRQRPPAPVGDERVL